MSADATPFGDQESEVEVNAPTDGTSEEQFEAPFNIDEASEEIRGELDRRLKEMQGAFTKKTQGLAETRTQYEQRLQAAQAWETLQSDPEAQQQYFRHLAVEQGYQLPEDDDTDPVEQLRARLDAQEARLTAREQAQQEADTVAQVENLLGQQLDELSVTDETERKWIVDSALTNAPTGDGIPNIAAAKHRFDELKDHVQKTYRASKKAPHVSRAGVAGQAKVDLSDEDQRRAQMLAIVQAASSD